MRQENITIRSHKRGLTHEEQRHENRTKNVQNR